MSTAFVFPDQGSQRPGMGEPWVGSPAWSLVDDASALLGRDVGRLLLHASAQELEGSREAQVTTFLVSLMAWELLHDLPDVSVVAGHSLGELAALVAAGALTCDDAIMLVGARGAALQEAAETTPGSMALVRGLDARTVQDVLSALDDVWIGQDDGPSQVVVSGTPAGVQAAAAALQAAGAEEVRPLPGRGACHTPLMASARARLAVALREVSWAHAALPVLSAVTGEPYDEDPVPTLTEQLTSPVRWHDVVRALPGLGVDRVVVLGPDGALADLVRQALPAVRVVAVVSPGDAARLD